MPSTNSSTLWPSDAAWPDAASAAPTTWWPSVQTVVKCCALVGLLVLHFLSRLDHSAAMPLSARHNYERCYGHSLSVLAGRGLRDLNVDLEPDGSPVHEFLTGQRVALSSAEFAAYFETATQQPAEAFPVGTLLASTRVLDLYVAAGLWQVFGISWTVLFTFYAVVSTGTGLLAFCIARRLGGSFWAGWLAAALLFASPLENHLSAWSIRDTSPLWFTAAGFAVLVCLVDRFRSPAANLASYAALSITPMLGLGWRTDVLALVPFLAVSMVLVLFRNGRRGGQIAAALGVFLLAAWLGQTGIQAIGPQMKLPVGSGFHMAYYGDASRCNLMGVENSFQVHRCDMQTLYSARHYDHVHNGESSPLLYLSSRYNKVCRDMFWGELRYGAYRCVQKFPSFFVSALDGLRFSYGSDTDADPGHQDTSHWPWLASFERNVLEPASSALPYLFPALVILVLLVGPEKLLSGLLALYAIYYAAILLVVLPEQKHTAPLLVPLNVLSGVGLWMMLQLAHAETWARLAQSLRGPRFRVAVAVIVACAVLGWVGISAARQTSTATRTKLIQAILDLARSNGEPAPDTIKGKRVFSVMIPPGSQADEVGYLIKLRAGSQPGLLYCRHLHLPQDWGWPRLLETRHCLNADREQYFFVSCWQEGRYGDPRPYGCQVLLDGAEDEILSCVRVDMSQWDGLPVSTVFYEGQSCPGYPKSIEPNSELRFSCLPAFAATSVDRVELSRADAETQFVAPILLKQPSKPLHHLLARKQDGTWWMAASTGHAFRPWQMSWLSPTTTWADLRQGDFNGDGMIDLTGRDASTGQWWISAPDGGAAPFHRSHDWTGGAVHDVQAGDFNGDGLADLAARGENGQWRVGLSDGINLLGQDWGACPAAETMQFVAGDFNGDGRADLAAFDPATGQWHVAISDGQQFVTTVWGQWSADAEWRDILVGDFNGDGRADIAGRDAKTGQWTIALSDGAEFSNHVAGAWPAKDWRDVQTGDFNGDGKTDLVGRDPETNQLLVALSEGTQFKIQPLAESSLFASGIFVGDFDGDGRDDVVCRNEETGALFVGVSDGQTLQITPWGKFLPGDQLSDLRVVSVWQERK